MENIQISYDGERVEITFKKGEGVSVCGNSKSWDDRVIPCCVDMEDAISEVFGANEKEKAVVISEGLRWKASEAATRVSDAFFWWDTREGHAYWSKVFSRLSQIGEDGVL